MRAGLLPRFVAVTTNPLSTRREGSAVMSIHGLSARSIASACSREARALSAAACAADSAYCVCRSIFLSIETASRIPAYPSRTRIRLAAQAIRSCHGHGEGAGAGVAIVM
jgi:hypothetical protein